MGSPQLSHLLLLGLHQGSALLLDRCTYRGRAGCSTEPSSLRLTAHVRELRTGSSLPSGSGCSSKWTKQAGQGWTLVPLLRLRGQWVQPNKNKFLSQSLPAGWGTQHVLAGAHGCRPTPAAQVWLLWSDRILAALYLETLSGRGRCILVDPPSTPRRAGPNIQDLRWALGAQSSVSVMTSYSMPWCCSC